MTKSPQQNSGKMIPVDLVQGRCQRGLPITSGIAILMNSTSRTSDIEKVWTAVLSVVCCSKLYCEEPHVMGRTAAWW